MLTKDTLVTGQEAREKLITGIRKCAAAVAATMGSAGKNALIEAIQSPNHFTTNDGATILESMRLSHPIEEMGRKILLEAVSRSNKASGDGSSTTCVLTAAIIEEGIKHLDKKSAMDIKRELEACIPVIEKSIEAQRKTIVSEDGVIELPWLEAVASISAEDEEIGKRIAEIYNHIGPKGIIHWDISKTTEDSYQIGKGITVEMATFVSPYMCDATTNGESTNQIRIKNPQILLSKQKLASAAELNEIAQALYNREVRDLVVFVDDVEPLVIPDLIKTRMMKGFRIVVVKMPTIFKDEWFEDLSKASGGKVADPTAGYPLKNITPADLGTFENIVITKEAAYIDGIKDLTTHIASFDDTDASKARATRLNTKTARYFVGGISDSAISHRRYKVEDAIAAAWQSLNGGIIAGGGIGLRNCVKDLPDTRGGEILKHALHEPMRQIFVNAGLHTKSDLIPAIIGYDARTGDVIDMFEAKIVDSATITLNACKNAISVAAAILTTETVVLLPREEQQMVSPPGVVI